MKLNPALESGVGASVRLGPGSRTSLFTQSALKWNNMIRETMVWIHGIGTVGGVGGRFQEETFTCHLLSKGKSEYLGCNDSPNK